MQRLTVTIDTKASVATGTAALVGHLIDKWVYISGTFVATVVVEMSPDDGATWETVSSFTAPGSVEVPQSVSHVRADTTAFTSGTPATKLTGRNVQPGAR